jgi:hypothetical protein
MADAIEQCGFTGTVLPLQQNQLSRQNADCGWQKGLVVFKAFAEISGLQGWGYGFH